MPLWALSHAASIFAVVGIKNAGSSTLSGEDLQLSRRLPRLFYKKRTPWFSFNDLRFLDLDSRCGCVTCVCVCVRHSARPLVSLGMLPERSLTDFSFDLKSTKAALALRAADVPRWRGGSSAAAWQRLMLDTPTHK